MKLYAPAADRSAATTQELVEGIHPLAIIDYYETARAVEARRAEIRATAPRGLLARIEQPAVSLERARALYLTGLTARQAVEAATPYGDMNLREFEARRDYLWSLVAPHGDSLAAFDAAIAAPLVD